MKKLKKLSLKQMEHEMPVLRENAQEKLVGGYFYDCFWRCVSYMEGGGGTEQDAEYWADQYYYYGMGCSDSASDYYYANGAGMESYDIGYYAAYRQSEGTYGYSDVIAPGYIGVFNTANNVGNYENTGTQHAVVITCVNPDGSAEYYDPQLGIYGTFTALDMSKIENAMY
jgi:hypothetical protein